MPGHGAFRTLAFSMSSLRLAIVSAISLCVGGVIGYSLRPALVPSASVAVPKTVATPATAVPNPTAPTSAASTAAVKARSEAPGAINPSVRDRIALLRWQRSLGAAPLANLYLGKNVNPTIAKYLDLTSAEEARITGASRDAEEQINRLRDVGATAHPSDDRKQLIVEVPGLDAAASRAIYDRFNAEVAATLDPDRLELLNLLTGESMDRLHDRFGLNSIRYELNLAPHPLADGRLLYDYKRHFIDADGTSKGWSSSTTTLEDIVKSAPTLARFLNSAQSAAPNP